MATKPTRRRSPRSIRLITANEERKLSDASREVQNDINKLEYFITSAAELDMLERLRYHDTLPPDISSPQQSPKNEKSHRQQHQRKAERIHSIRSLLTRSLNTLLLLFILCILSAFIAYLVIKLL